MTDVTPARVMEVLQVPVRIADIDIHTSASIGIALYPEDGATKDDLLNTADAAMYTIKNTKHEIGTQQAEHLNP